MLWPLIGGASLLLSMIKFSGNALELSGCSRARQFGELIIFTYAYGFQPSEYYERKLYEESVSQYSDFLSEWDTKALAVATNGNGIESVKSKYLFDQVCKKSGLPIAPTFAYLEPDKNDYILEADASPLPREDLFFKPAYGMEGIGIERWDFDASSELWCFEQTKHDEASLRAHFHKMSSAGPYLLQVALTNHPSISSLSPGGLITFRLVTVSDNTNEPVVIASHMSLPRHLTTTNHESNGGIEAELNLETQILDAGYSFNPKPERHSRHPTTGAQIEGRFCEEWAKLRTLAVQLHAQFPDVTSIGWDLAYTSTGPIVLEGNTFWGLHNGMFLGKTPYVSKLLSVIRANN